MAEKVIVFYERRPPIITQMDLAEERAYALEASSILAQLEQKREWIRSKLKEGWKVEEGLRRAELVPTPSGTYTKKSGYKLVVR